MSRRRRAGAATRPAGRLGYGPPLSAVRLSPALDVLAALDLALPLVLLAIPALRALATSPAIAPDTPAEPIDAQSARWYSRLMPTAVGAWRRRRRWSPAPMTGRARRAGTGHAMPPPPTTAPGHPADHSRPGQTTVSDVMTASTCSIRVSVSSGDVLVRTKITIDSPSSSVAQP